MKAFLEEVTSQVTGDRFYLGSRNKKQRLFKDQHMEKTSKQDPELLGSLAVPEAWHCCVWLYQPWPERVSLSLSFHVCRH